MRIGLVCPYSLDVPGGVQIHVAELAEHLIAMGHEVSVLAPADDDTPVPPYVVAAGRAVPVRYNGSVARVSFGPVSAARVRRWLEAGSFDVLHLHEPVTPSISVLALRAATGPVVATFHTSNLRSRAMQVAFPLLRPSLEKLTARIAVSEAARRTVVEHLDGDAVVVPNGVEVERFATAERRPGWAGTDEEPVLAFVGRIDEPRKGLHVLLEAMPAVLDAVPGARLVVAGRGDLDDARRAVADVLGARRGRVELLGGVDEADKAALLRSATAYVGPHTGGESFGIVLVEAMSAGAAVVASDLAAFRQVLDGGRLGLLARAGSPDDLARALVEALTRPEDRARRTALASAAVRRYDWSVVSREVLAVYETVVEGAEAVGLEPEGLGLVARWRQQ